MKYTHTHSKGMERARERGGVWRGGVGKVKKENRAREWREQERTHIQHTHHNNRQTQQLYKVTFNTWMMKSSAHT